MEQSWDNDFTPRASRGLYPNVGGRPLAMEYQEFPHRVSATPQTDFSQRPVVSASTDSVESFDNLVRSSGNGANVLPPRPSKAVTTDSSRSSKSRFPIDGYNQVCFLNIASVIC